MSARQRGFAVDFKESTLGNSTVIRDYLSEWFHFHVESQLPKFSGRFQIENGLEEENQNPEPLRTMVVRT